MQRSNDFDPAQLAAVSSKHDQELSYLYNRVGTDEAFAQSFTDAAAKSKPMDRALSEVIQHIIQQDPEVQKILKKCVQEIDRKWWNGAVKVLLGAIGGVVITIITQFILYKLGMPGK
jgi:hypothetical protein